MLLADNSRGWTAIVQRLLRNFPRLARALARPEYEYKLLNAMMPANVIQLRQMLSERFPGARMSLQSPAEKNNCWPTGIPQIDNPLQGGLPKGALTEIIGPPRWFWQCDVDSRTAFNGGQPE
jgi:hypothetical protein